MPDLLLELLCEEIPARMQARAVADLKTLVTDGLVAAGLVYESAQAFATPRRLALTVTGLPIAAAARREERKGPRVGAPKPAIDGFLKSAGLADIADAKVQADAKKGDFYVAVIETPGRAATEVIATLVPQVVRAFPWPKSMRWGAASTSTASMRWVRPLQSILCTFGPETEEPEIVHFEIDGIASGDTTRGHRFMAPGTIRVRRFEDYVAKLESSKVVLDPERRKAIIATEAKNLALAHGLDLVEDPGLLDEVAGLVEWPVVLMGSFDPAFLNVPGEVIRATIRANQKCFVLKDPATGKLAPKFLLTANIEARDGGKTIIAGNERVIRARLSDAKYFWETDRKPLPDYAHVAPGKPLDQRLAKLKALNIVFHEKLGTQGKRVEDTVVLANEIATVIDADPKHVARAAELCKADLVTEVVGEFPETQGLMGATYAALQGEPGDVVTAIEEHYKPVGPTDRVPTNRVAVVVALADKVDTLVGFWAIEEKPTGSKDPYALRRAALGVIRLLVENGISLPLMAAFKKHYPRKPPLGVPLERLDGETRTIDQRADAAIANAVHVKSLDLLAFFHDRLKVMLREQGARHDLVDAVLAAGASPGDPGDSRARPGAHQPDDGPRIGLAAVRGRDDAAGRSVDAGLAAVGGREPSVAGSPSPATAGEGGPQDRVGGSAKDPTPPDTPPTPTPSPPQAGGGATNDDLLLIVRRVEALGRFLATSDGKALLAGVKRATNILRIEEKKDGASYDAAPDHHMIHAAGAPEERELLNVLDAVTTHAAEHVARDDFEGAMGALAQARPAVDAFFEKILVNDPDPAVRANRLRLLSRLRAATRTVADFSKIEG